MPKKKRRIAFKQAFKGLIDDERLQVVEPIAIKEPKTKNVAAIYKKWNVPTDSLLILDQIDSSFQKASRNISDVRVTTVEGFNTYECVRARRVFITAKALEKLTLRMSGELKR